MLISTIPLPSLQILPSLIPNAGFGLFSSTLIPKDHLLGTYNGRLTSIHTFCRYKKKLPTNPGQYSWVFDDGNLLDPTDFLGVLQDKVPSAIPFILSSAQTTTCYINEPCLGSDCNVYVEVDDSTYKVEFRTSRVIDPGEELFVDYGQHYDRTNYQPNDPRKWLVD